MKVCTLTGEETTKLLAEEAARRLGYDTSNGLRGVTVMRETDCDVFLCDTDEEARALLRNIKSKKS